MGSFVWSQIVKARARKGQNTYVAFLDIRKAFPTTFRAAMLTRLHKLLSKLPGGLDQRKSKIWRIIHNMYENVFSFVRVDNDVVADSDEYEVSHGVREGSVLSPLIFTVFIDSVIEMLFIHRFCY